MITTCITLDKALFKWVDNVCDTYDLNTETLLFLSVQYAGKDVKKDVTMEQYCKYMNNKNIVIITITMTETLDKMVERLLRGTILTKDFVVNLCLDKVRNNFEDFERWYDNQHLAHAEGIPGVPVTLKQRKEEKNNDSCKFD